MHLRGSKLAGQEEGRWRVVVKTAQAAGWLNGRLRQVVEQAAGGVAGEAVAVEFVTAEELDPATLRRVVAQEVRRERPAPGSEGEGRPRDYSTMAQLAPRLKPVEWVWKSWIPRGMLSLLGAAPGAGKSLLALDLCRRVTHSMAWPDGQAMGKGGAATVYVDAEAVPQLLKERAGAWGMDFERLWVMLPRESYGMIDFGEEPDQDRLCDLLYQAEPELVVVDSMSVIQSKGENNVEEVRRVLGFLAAVSREHDCGLLLIHHLRKRMMPLFELVTPDDFRGSSHIIAMARSVLGLSVIKTGEEVDRNGPRRLELVKTNLTRYPKPLGVEFVEEGEGVRLRYTDAAPASYREPTQADECGEWLLALLDEAGEPVQPKEAVKAAEADGFSRMTLYRARKKLDGTVVDTADPHDPENRWALAGS